MSLPTNSLALFTISSDTSKLVLRYSHITHSNHAHSLPDTETNTGSDTTVQALHAVLAVDVLGRLHNSQVLGAVGVNSLRLHLDTDNLDRLVPGRETTTNGGGENLLPGIERLALLLAGEVTDGLLGETRETEPATPVRHLTDSNSVDTLVDTGNTLLPIDVGKDGEGRWGLDAGGSLLVAGDLYSLHTCAEAHGRIGLGNTTDDTSGDTGSEVAGAELLRIVLRLGTDEEEDSSLGGGLNPGPRNETLVD